ncbi:MAG: TolC family protein [Gemmatimonadota bacterium]
MKYHITAALRIAGVWCCALGAVTAVARAQDSAASASAPLTLEQVVERASRESYGAQAARSGLDAARLRSSAFDARLLPQLSLGGMAPSYNKSISAVIQPDGSTAYVPVGEMETAVNLTLSQAVPVLGARVFLSSLINRIEPLSSDRSRYYQSTPMLIGIEQELFRPRTQLWDGREQDLRLRIAERLFLESREEVAARAAAAYFDVHAAQVAVTNTIANVAVNDSLYQISQGRYQVGKIAENDLLQSELAVLRARTAADAAQLERERALAALRLELNLPDDAPLAIAPPPVSLNLTIDPKLAAAEALKNRRELTELELQDVQTQRRITTARLQNSFSARLTAGFGFNQTARYFDEAYRSPLQQQRFELQVDMPLVRWGAGRDEVGAARAEAARVGALADRSRRELSQQAYFAGRRFTQAQSQLVVAAKADTVATRRFDVAKDRYVIGRIGIGDLYIAQTEKDAALKSYVEAVRAYWLAFYELRRITLYDFQVGRPID